MGKLSKWEIARYLIDAKKCVDSLMYVIEYAEELRFYGLREFVDEKKSTFYINCCAVIDNCYGFSSATKKELCDKYSDIKDLYYNRDKNYAHKDSNYIPQVYEKWDALVEEMKNQLIHVLQLCKKELPNEITLDFVPHDRKLFRSIHKILSTDEEEILNRKYLLRNTNNIGKNDCQRSYKIFWDPIELRHILDDERKEYATIIKLGICPNEDVQEIQDSCIRINTLFSLNVWCKLDLQIKEDIDKLIKLGFLDEYGIMQPLTQDPIIRAKIDAIIFRE